MWLQGIPSTKPATTDIGLTPAISKIDAKPDTSKIGSATKGHVESESLLKHKADDNKAAHGTGMGLPNSVQDTVRSSFHIHKFSAQAYIAIIIACMHV